MLLGEEFLLLWEKLWVHVSYDPFTLVNMDEAECKAEFRVEKNDLHKLAEALQFQEHWNATKEPYAMEWGTMHAAETTVIPLSFQWYDFQLNK